MLTTIQLAQQTTLINLSVLFERMSFYMMRSVLLGFFIGTSFAMKEEEALEVYSLFLMSFIFSRVLGGLLSDFVLGSKRSALLGCAITTLGYISLSISTKPFILIGFTCVVIGNALYSPSIYAHLGKTFYSRPKKLDGAFMLMYLSIIIGAFIAPFIALYFETKFDLKWVFFACAFLMALATLCCAFLKQEEKTLFIKAKKNNNTLVILVYLGVVLTGFFYWIFYSFNSVSIEVIFERFPQSFYEKVQLRLIAPPLVTTSLSIILSVVWFFWHVKTIVKMMVGIVSITLGCWLLFSFSTDSKEVFSPVYIVSIFLIGLSENLMPALINSVIVQYLSPKYFATLMAVSSFVVGFVSNEVAQLVTSVFDFGLFGSLVAGIGFAVMSLTLIVILLLTFKREVDNQQPNQF